MCAEATAKLPKAKLSREQLHWLLDNGDATDPERDVAIRVAALTGLARLGDGALESAALVARYVAHADVRVCHAAAKAIQKIRTTKKP